MLIYNLTVFTEEYCDYSYIYYWLYLHLLPTFLPAVSFKQQFKHMVA